MITRHNGPIEYFVKGETPRLLLWSGMHGDEYESSDCLAEYVKQHEADLPDFLCIPQVSPSAVSLKTRRNQWKRDVNRNFFDTTIDEEVHAVIEILRPHAFDLSLNIHEDPDRSSGFYLYDSDLLSHENLAHMRELILQTGARLYTGIDDPADAHLGLHVEKGYISTPLVELPKDAGFSWVWLLQNGIANRALDPEIPGKAPLELKKKLIEAIFSFTLPLLRQS